MHSPKSRKKLPRGRRASQNPRKVKQIAIRVCVAVVLMAVVIIVLYRNSPKNNIPMDSILIAVQESDTEKWGYVNTNGEYVIEPQFDGAWNFDDNGLAFARKNGKWGCINKSGEFVTKPKFDYVGHFSDNGLAVVKISKISLFNISRKE